jgi:nitroimidazol reductase NimA-like FMN-containing flavoprotein (pyridoxamine 5'-phosphate oxidase superfamily)
MPEFRELSEQEAADLLRRNHVGRLAFVSEGRTEVFGINVQILNGRASSSGRTTHPR